MLYLTTKYGVNHKKEKILKLYSAACPYCNRYMRYFEFQFDVDIFEAGPDNNPEMQKLALLQQFEEILEKTKRGEKLRLRGLLVGCYFHYLNTSKKDLDRLEKKPYILMDSEDVWKFNQIPVSHIYLAEKL
jgi:hypothetical protein